MNRNEKQKLDWHELQPIALCAIFALILIGFIKTCTNPYQPIIEHRLDSNRAKGAISKDSFAKLLDTLDARHKGLVTYQPDVKQFKISVDSTNNAYKRTFAYDATRTWNIKGNYLDSVSYTLLFNLIDEAYSTNTRK
jgi:hypothetical protein